MTDHKSELLIAAATAMLVEGVAVGLFFACAFVWIAIFATWGMQ